MSKTGMLNGTWLGMIPHYEFIMPTVSTVMSGRAPCQLLHATVTARQWAAGSRATLLINRTDTVPKKNPDLQYPLIWQNADTSCISLLEYVSHVLQHTVHVNPQQEYMLI